MFRDVSVRPEAISGALKVEANEIANATRQVNPSRVNTRSLTQYRTLFPDRYGFPRASSAAPRNPRDIADSARGPFASMGSDGISV